MIDGNDDDDAPTHKRRSNEDWYIGTIALTGTTNSTGTSTIDNVIISGRGNDSCNKVGRRDDPREICISASSPQRGRPIQREEHDRQRHHLEMRERLLQQRCTLVLNPSGSATADVGIGGISIDATTTRCRYWAAHPTAGTMMIALTTEGKTTTTIAGRTITCLSAR